MTLSVIGAGFGRTGTDSLRDALNILGFGPCHHMFELNTHEDQRIAWRSIMKGESPDWDTVFRNYGSCVDWPSAYFWRELSGYYPKAKVILTWRPAEEWWASVEKTFVHRMRSGSLDPDSVGAHVLNKVFNGRVDDRDHAIGVYNANTDAVTSTISPTRLLVYRPGDGWNPLCGFLDTPVPSVPYPHRNAAKEFNARGDSRRQAR